jgi:hypothetical protein
MDAIFAYRLYIYKDKYFPRMNDPGQSLWAWSRRCKIRATERNPANLNLKNMPPSDKTLRIDHPYVLLHNSWPTEAAVQEKMRHYKAVRNAPQEHPLRFGGELAELPSYARVDTPPYSIEGVED